MKDPKHNALIPYDLVRSYEMIFSVNPWKDLPDIIGVHLSDKVSTLLTPKLTEYLRLHLRDTNTEVAMEFFSGRTIDPVKASYDKLFNVVLNNLDPKMVDEFLTHLPTVLFVPKTDGKFDIYQVGDLISVSNLNKLETNSRKQADRENLEKLVHLFLARGYSKETEAAYNAYTSSLEKYDGHNILRKLLSQGSTLTGV